VGGKLSVMIHYMRQAIGFCVQHYINGLDILCVAKIVVRRQLIGPILRPSVDVSLTLCCVVYGMGGHNLRYVGNGGGTYSADTAIAVPLFSSRPKCSSRGVPVSEYLKEQRHCPKLCKVNR